jgi:hypothetical protein
MASRSAVSPMTMHIAMMFGESVSGACVSPPCRMCASVRADYTIILAHSGAQSLTPVQKKSVAPSSLALIRLRCPPDAHTHTHTHTDTLCHKATTVPAHVAMQQTPAIGITVARRSHMSKSDYEQN